jgi:RNA polymerase sigma-70 factor (ECF subfamily)
VKRIDSPQTPIEDSAAGCAGAETAPPDGWLEQFRPWLNLVARIQVESCFQGKFDASDIVQQTLIEAWRSVGRFRGTTDAERAAWLRQILLHVLAHEVRRHRFTQKRDLAREVSLDQQLADSSQRLDAVLAAATSSPSQHAERREQQLRLAQVLEALPEDYREVIILRNLQGLSHAEVAQRMGRSSGAVRMLWARALQALREQFQDDQPEAT